MKLLCFGLGYCALRVTEKLIDQGMKIVGTSRNPKSFRAIQTFIFNQETPLSQHAFEGVTHILCSIPPVQEEDLVLKHHAQDLLKLSELKWVGYLSTTGVYGDHQCSWVDEETLPSPLNDRSKIRLKIENQWLDLRKKQNFPIHVFRVAGIYGPYRNVLNDIRQGCAQRVIKESHVFSRIHVEDVAQTLLISMKSINPGRIYNIADDYPSSSYEVITYAATLLKRPPPPTIPFEKATLSDFARSFYQENKRVKNKRIKEELKVNLFYPSYREGLQAILREFAF
jgi:nucleoside-diphosphate-sugar epimerase